MTADQLKQARHKLGLSLAQLGAMLGVRGDDDKRRLIVHQMELGQRDLSQAQKRLIRAYLRGYRPRDWPLAN